MHKKNGVDFYYTNAIENALKNNQVHAVNELIRYIVKYQNNFVSSYLFLKLLPVLIEKGIATHDLLASDIFNVVFDFDDWPSNHYNPEDCIRAYNGSYFDVRHSYDIVFPDIVPMDRISHDNEEECGKFEEADGGHNLDKKKIYKIKYSINLLA